MLLLTRSLLAVGRGCSWVAMRRGWKIALALSLLAWAGGCRSEPVPSPARSPGVTFVEVTDEVQLRFAHDCGPKREFFVPEIMGSGVGVFDFDRDGDLDIYLIQGRPSPGAADAPPVPNQLFQRQADGTYVDVSESSGLDDDGYGMGVACGDVNNDGWTDVYVTNYGANALYLNQGDGSFENVTDRAGVGDEGWGTSAIMLDFDRDGWLDLYVANYVIYEPSRVCEDKSGRPEFCGPEQFRPAPDRLYRNQGDGTFADVSDDAGITQARGRGLGVVAADFNGDHWLDLYVANDMDPNHLWINQGDGTFREDAILLGVAFNAAGQTEASMGVLCEDLDGDLDFDLFMTHLRGESNTLYRNEGGTFRDSTSQFGLLGPSLPFTGFGAAAGDFDHDGDLDIVFVNGHVFRASEGTSSSDSFWQAYAQPAVLLLNEDGRFEDASDQAGDLNRGPPGRPWAGDCRLGQ